MATATRERARGNGGATFCSDLGTVSVPNSVVDIDSFREWLDTDAVPEKTRVWFLDGKVWIDMCREQLFTHAALKGEITAVLHGIVKPAGLGRVYPDGVLVTNRAANLSGNPDAVYVSNDSLTAGRIRRVPGKEGGFTELDGTPDMILEVVSDSSERKDNQTLLERYWAAGIPEYWIVDGRGAEVEFTIYKHGPKGYTAVRKQAGWLKSPEFGKAFRLVRGTDRQGDHEFTLEVK